MDTQLIGYLEAMEQRIVTTVREEVRAGQESLREEIRAVDESLREEVRTGQESLREEIRAVDESLREEIRAGQESLREAMEVAHGVLREELLAENRATRVLFENLEVTVRAIWTEGVSMITEKQDRQIEKQENDFDSRVRTVEAAVGGLSETVHDHEDRITTLERG